jgi:hypothetical protein
LLDGAKVFILDRAKVFTLDGSDLFMLVGSVIVPVLRHHFAINCFKIFSEILLKNKMESYQLK